MKTTDFLGLSLRDTETEDLTLPFIEWRREINGSVDSAFVRIDRAFSQDTATPITRSVSGALIDISDAAKRVPISMISKIDASQPGSEIPTPDNIRPISGWDTVTLTRAGKSLIDIPEVTTTRYDVDIAASGNRITMNGTSSAATSGTATLYKMPIKAGQYMLSGAVTGSLSATDGTSTVILRASRDSGGTVDVIEARLRHNTVSQASLVVPYDGYVMVWAMLANNSAVYDAYTIDIQLEAGDTATSIIPPVGHATLTAALPETVYGGSLDWTTGVLTVNQFSHVFDGQESIKATAIGGYTRFQYEDNVPKTITYQGKCSHYKYATAPFVNNATNNAIFVRSGIYWRDDSKASVEEMKAWLAEQYAAGTPVTVMADVEPYTIQLDPQTMDMLKGYNALWSDTGDTSVAYVADTKIYIDNAIAAIAAAVINA